MLKKSAALVAALALTALTVLPAAAQLPTASPESQGFDSARLKKLDDYMAKVVADGRVAGMTTMLVRHGKIVHSRIYGQADLAKGTPMTADTIFRIYSMTKPITGVAMMMLFEEGKWQMDDPVTKFVPEFKNLRVMTGTDKKGNMITVPVTRPPTMREIMSHTAGFGYGLDNRHAVDRMIQKENVLPTATQHCACCAVFILPNITALLLLAGCRSSQWQRRITAIARQHKAVAWFSPPARSCTAAIRCTWWPPRLTAGLLPESQGFG